jgi:hypothetical protein
MKRSEAKAMVGVLTTALKLHRMHQPGPGMFFTTPREKHVFQTALKHARWLVNKASNELVLSNKALTKSEPNCE